MLNLGPERIDTALIIHNALGKNHVIPVVGYYRASSSVCVVLDLIHIGRLEHTCFANSLTYLTRLTGPIRHSRSLLPETHAVNAPREIIKLIEWLMTYATEVVSIM